MVEYQEYLESAAWKQTRSKRLDIDGNMCKQCKSTNNLHVHHITYERLGYERMGDLITLCKSCHEKEHDKLKALDEVCYAICKEIHSIEKRICNIANTYCAEYGYEHWGMRVFHLDEFKKLKAIVDGHIFSKLRNRSEYRIIEQTHIMQNGFARCLDTHTLSLPIRKGKVRELLNQGKSTKEISEIIHESIPSVRKIIKQINGG